MQLHRGGSHSACDWLFPGRRTPGMAL